MNKDLIISIDSNTRNIELLMIEGRKIEPRTVFRFENGKWIAILNNFPVSSDNILNIFILADGDTGNNSQMKVRVDGTDKGTYSLFEPFNRARIGQFNQNIHI